MTIYPNARSIEAEALAAQQWEVFPVTNKKVPLTTHGMLDATIDVEKVRAWWKAKPWANIGMRPPASVAVIDIDPRNGGEESWQAWIAEHGDVSTRTCWSGAGDGGRHLYFLHPGPKLRSKPAPGIDVKTRSGFVVVPPSLHAKTGMPYRWDDPEAEIEAMPIWLAKLLIKPVVPPPPPRPLSPYTAAGDSIADWYSNTRRWRELLVHHGWTLVSGDGDSDGSRWKHPTASHDWSATIKHEMLFVYSTQTDFDDTEAGEPRGYTRFRAFAVLDHGGDLSAAGRAARELRGDPPSGRAVFQ
jgi:hypothetical protein